MSYITPEYPHTPYVAKEGLELVYVHMYVGRGVHLPTHAHVEANSQHQVFFSIAFHLSFLRDSLSLNLEQAISSRLTGQ